MQPNIYDNFKAWLLLNVLKRDEIMPKKYNCVVKDTQRFLNLEKLRK